MIRSISTCRTNTGVVRSAIRRTITSSTARWSNELSFASPEADFVAQGTTRSVEGGTARHSGPVWSGKISFASPEADCTAIESKVHSRSVHSHAQTRRQDAPLWTGNYSFASPEADFTGEVARSRASASEQPDNSFVWSGQLSFASPESDFTGEAARMPEMDVEPAQSQLYNGPVWSGQLSFASPESDWQAETILPWVRTSPSTVSERLPRTLQQALMEEHVAIVVTTAMAPHKIVHVNRAWEAMCGYHKSEVLDKDLSIIQGPETNTKLAESTVAHLVEDHVPIDMYLVNYRRSGEKFYNHVSMGPMKLNEESSEDDFLVGILEEVRPEDVPLRMVTY